MLRQVKLEKRVLLVSGSESRTGNKEGNILGAAAADQQVKRRGEHKSGLWEREQERVTF